MLRLLGICFLSAGCMGLGWSLKERLKKSLEEMYQIRQMMQMMQNEIIYSRAPLPEACLRIAGRTGEPYRKAFAGIHKEMSENRGTPFGTVWKCRMEECVCGLVLPVEEKARLVELGGSAGFMDGGMQAQVLEQYIRRLDLSIGKQEKEMADKSRVIMSLSVMGGLLIAVILV